MDCRVKLLRRVISFLCWRLLLLALNEYRRVCRICAMIFVRGGEVQRENLKNVLCGGGYWAGLSIHPAVFLMARGTPPDGRPSFPGEVKIVPKINPPYHKLPLNELLAAVVKPRQCRFPSAFFKQALIFPLNLPGIFIDDI